MANNIPYINSKEFLNEKLQDILNSQGVKIGEYKKSGLLSFFQVDSSGHMVPADKPESAYLAINSLL